MSYSIKVLALLAAFGCPALQAQPRGERPSPQQLIDRATDRLDLSPQQQAQLQTIAERYAADASSTRWELAAEIEAVLTDDQKASLLARREQARERRGPRGEARPSDRKHRAGKMNGRLGLSESQREQFEALRETTRAEREALRAELQAGTVTEAAFVERSRALRERSRAAMQNVLTPEQREQAEQARARREAEQAARERVLQITPEQKAAFESAMVEAARSGEPRRVRAAASDILTEEQREIVAVHRALAPRHQRQGHRQRGEQKARPEPRRDAADRGPSEG